MTDRDLFIAALEQPDDKRPAWLDRVCGDDADLRRRLDVLLRAHELASQFLASPAVEQAAVGSTRDADPAKGERDDAEVLALLAPAEKPGQLGKLDHYEVLEVVGQGAMGVVVKAFDPKLHRVVAIKLMASHLAANPKARRRFEREARAVAAVRNEHVVAIHGVETGGAIPYLVMEFIGGVSLQERLDKDGPLEVKEILRIGLQAANGLAAAHAQGLVHRDVKPANILLENGVERVKITDFGLARAVDDVNLTQSGVITGTPNYMSPEQADGGTVDHRSDLFSLGSVLYALATGHPPFRASGMAAVLKRVAADAPRPVREVNADVPDWLEAIIAKLHAKDPAGRFQSAKEVAELLGQHLAHLQQPGQVPRPAKLASMAPPARRRPSPLPRILGECSIAGVLVVIATISTNAWSGDEDTRSTIAVGWIVTICGWILFCLRSRPGPKPSPGESILHESLPKSPASRSGGWGLVVWWLAYCFLPVGAVALGLVDYLFDLDSRRMHSFQPPVFGPLSLVLLGAWFALGLFLTWLRLRKRRAPGAGRARRFAALATLAVAAALLVVLSMRLPQLSRPPLSRPGGGEAPPTMLKVVKDDPDAEVIVAADGKRLIHSGPGERSIDERSLDSGAAYYLSIRKGDSEVHREVVRLRFGELRQLHIPPFALPRETVKLVPRAGGFPADVTRMQIAPDRAAVAVESLDGPILVFDAATGQERFTLARPKSDSTAFGFTPDGKSLAYLTRSEKGECVLRLADAKDGSDRGIELKPAKGAFANARALAFSADGSRLAVSGASHRPDGDFQSRLHCWEWPGGKELPAAREAQEGTIEAMRFTPDGNEVVAVTGRKDSVAWRWGAEVMAISRAVQYSQFAHDLVASGGGALLFAGWSERMGMPEATWMPALNLWGQPASDTTPEALGSARLGCIALSEDGRLAACGNKSIANAAWADRAAVRVWDTKSGEERALLLGHTDWILDVAFMPDGKALASASKDGTLRWWVLPAPVRP